MSIQSLVLAGWYQDEQEVDQSHQSSPLSRILDEKVEAIQPDRHQDDWGLRDERYYSEHLDTLVAAASGLVKVSVIDAIWNLSLSNYDVTDLILSEVLAEIIVVNFELIFALLFGHLFGLC